MVHRPRRAVWDKENSHSRIPSLPVASRRSTASPLGSCTRQKTVSRQKGRLPFLPPPPDTHQQAGFHSALVRKLVQPEGHDSDFDGVARLVAAPIRLDEAGDVPGAEGEGGAVGENQAVPSVAPHRQVKQGILG